MHLNKICFLNWCSLTFHLILFIGVVSKLFESKRTAWFSFLFVCLCFIFSCVSISKLTSMCVRECIVCSIRILGLKFSTHFVSYWYTFTCFFSSCWNSIHFDFRCATSQSPVFAKNGILCRTIIFTALCVVVAHLITVCLCMNFQLIFSCFVISTCG